MFIIVHNSLNANEKHILGKFLPILIFKSFLKEICNCDVCISQKNKWVKKVVFYYCRPLQSLIHIKTNRWVFLFCLGPY